MKRIVVIGLWLLSQTLSGQDRNIDPARIIDDLSGIQEDDADYELIYENLMQLLSHPADINTITQEELRQLHLLTEKQVADFIQHRTDNGELLSLYELQAVPSFDDETIRRITPFVKVRDPENAVDQSLLRRVIKDGNHYLITRWERTIEGQLGYGEAIEPEQKYLGTPDKYYMRFRSSIPGSYSFGVTVEKDGGEKILWNPSNGKFGSDYLSAHAQLLNKGFVKNIIVGDFQTQFGQGLIFGGAFGLGKGGETIGTSRRNNLGFLPHTSAGEAGFFRGAGMTLEPIKNIFISTLFSQAHRDAALGGDHSAGYEIRSLQYSGYHRNENERINERKAKEKLYGGVIEYRRQKFTTGIIAQQINYNFPITKDTSLYNQFAFRGKQNTNVGFHVNGNVGNINFFGEAAHSLDAGYAVVGGVMIALDPRLDMSMVFRKFDKDYHPFYANPFSESTQPINETGLYWGWKYKWNRRYSIAGYVDLFKFPWIAFRRYKPSTGHEWLLRFNYQPSRKAMMFVQVREESKLRNTSEGHSTYSLGEGIKRNYWFSVNYTASDNVSFKSRMQYSTFSFDGSTSDGLVLSQSIRAEIGKFQVSMNYAVFDADDFDNRQYVYENDVYLAFSLPAYDGVGVRNYFMLEYKVTKAMTIWLRYACTRYTDREEIGTGLETIKGNTRNDVKFQTILKF
jgi:hypothetical protein